MINFSHDDFGNTRQWMHVNDVVLLDRKWFTGEKYRYRREKSMNRYIVDNDGHLQLLVIKHIVESGRSVKLFPMSSDRERWPTPAPLKITVAGHGKLNPIMFVSREIELRL